MLLHQLPCHSLCLFLLIEFFHTENKAVAVIDAEHLEPGAVLAELYRLDVLGTRAFLTPAFRVGHLLAFMQGVESDTLEARRVEKQVFSLPRVYEPEALVRQPLDTAFGHLCVSRSDCLN